MKQRTILLILLLACIVFAVGCGDKDDTSSKSSSTSESRDAKPEDKDWEEELEEYLETAKLKASTNAVVHTGQSGVYMELSLHKGAHIDVLQKRGYTFEGYETKDGVRYVDSNGKVIKEYKGNNTLLLTAAFSSEEFKVRFFLDGEQSKELNSVNYFFDKALDLGFIHLGQELNGRCIIGFEDKAGNPVIDANSKNVKIQDLGACVDYDAKTVDLYAVSTAVTLSQTRMSTYQVSDEGFLEQSLDSKKAKYDYLDIAKETDLDALKALGYTTVTISIECDIKAGAGKQHIKILSDWPEKEKEIKNVTVFDSEKLDYTEANESFKGSIALPIDMMGSSLYVAYNATGTPLKSGEWKSDGMEVKVLFSK